MGWPVSGSAVACALLRVGRSGNKRVSKFRFGLFYVFKHEFSAKMFEIRRLYRAYLVYIYGRETNVTSLFGCAVHAGRPDSVRQRGRIIWCRPNRTGIRRGTSGTVVEVQTNGVYENNYVRTAALADSITYQVHAMYVVESE